MFKHTDAFCDQIKKKYGHPCAAEEEGVLPEGLGNLVNRAGFFRKGPHRDGQLDPVTIQTISKTPAK